MDDTFYEGLIKKWHECYSMIGVDGYKRLIEISEHNRERLGHNGYLDAVRQYVKEKYDYPSDNIRK